MNLTVILLLALVLVNVAASVLVLRSDALSASQRAMQLGFVWLVPVLGAVFCAAVVHSQAAAATEKSTIDPLYLPGDGGGPDGPSIGIGICGCSGDSGGGDGGGGD